jgi:hypothetical protein
MNLKSALKLYEILKDYLPEKYEDHFDFVSQIIHNISVGEHKDAYADALDILNNRKFDNEELRGYTTEELFRFFSDKLIDVNIYEIIIFCSSMGI